MENIDIDKLTPMMKIYCETKEQYRDCILFYRPGTQPLHPNGAPADDSADASSNASF